MYKGNTIVTNQIPNKTQSGIYYRVYPKRWHPYFYILKLLTSKIQSSAIDYISKITEPVLLDMGCGNMPYRLILDNFLSKYIGADIAENEQADIHISADGQIPLPDGCIDIVLSTQVLEHVTSPEKYLSECNRLLKVGGMIILSTHGYWYYHPVPTDFWRWTGAGLRKILQDAGFQIIEFHGLMSLASSAMQLMQFAIEQQLPSSRRIKMIFYFFMQLIVQLMDNIFSMGRDEDACVFFAIAKK
jgi:SAM-dependent methyltransferase